MINAITLAHSWSEEALSGEFETLGDIAERYGDSSRSLSNLLALAILAPDIVERQRSIYLTVERLSK
ncbi:MAG: hypothetical protein RLO50_22130 [Azospirillaceae bacterium]